MPIPPPPLEGAPPQVTARSRAWARAVLVLAVAMVMSASSWTVTQALSPGDVPVPSKSTSDSTDGTDSTAGSARQYARAAFRTTNEIRVARERAGTSENRCLHRFARRQANALAARDIESLEPSDHQPLRPILRRCHLDLVGENLALGFSTGRQAVKQGWMRSPSHRANILERRYRHMALVSRKTDSGRWVAVQLFGRRA